MTWGVGVACFFGGAVLANAVPHLFLGITGRSAPTPFASPPFRGQSPPAVNVLWGLCNVAASYLLLVRVAELDLENGSQVAIVLVGFALMAFVVARAFRKLREERSPR